MARTAALQLKYFIQCIHKSDLLGEATGETHLTSTGCGLYGVVDMDPANGTHSRPPAEIFYPVHPQV